jgi:ferredoxin
MKIFYNSATGNSLYVAKAIRDKFDNCELISMTKVLKENKIEVNDGVIGFVYPIHCGGLPIIVSKFISKLRINEGAYIFAVGVTGGGGANISFNQMNKLLDDNFKINNYCTIKYISNYLKAGRNPTEKRAKDAIKENESILYNFIDSLKKKELKSGNFKQGIGGLGYKAWKNLYKNKDKNFNVNDQCISCNMCQKVCPVGNVIMKDNRPVWSGKCTDCMACINICPKQAINIGKATIKKNRYLNPYITREELL